MTAGGISAIVVCFNEEDNIRDCLESLKWVDEIVVVDSYSTDRTLEICREYTDRIIQRPWAGYGDQMAFAHSRATKQWVLRIDADERVSDGLRQEIVSVLSRSADQVDGYMVPRLAYYLNRWWRRGGWYPDRSIRLFRKEKATWAGEDPHPKVTVAGKTRRLRNPLYHFSYRDISDHLRRINDFTSISSRQLRRQGKKWRWVDNLFRPLFRFCRFYIWKRGFLEGFPGFFVAATAAIYVFLKYARLRELELEARREGGTGRAKP
ncbi:MAG: glycosyltransferase family 2 protein [Deltaproteobacteria bacterium]|nr:glycosyltransferase family 2 protein [Deltaproteobacteria bacterium]